MLHGAPATPPRQPGLPNLNQKQIREEAVKQQAADGMADIHHNLAPQVLFFGADLAEIGAAMGLLALNQDQQAQHSPAGPDAMDLG